MEDKKERRESPSGWTWINLGKVSEPIAYTPGCFVSLAHKEGSHGYAQINFRGKVTTIPALICRARGTPTDKYLVAWHLCGHRWCVNPDHIKRRHVK